MKVPNDLLIETCKMGSRPIDTSIDPNICFDQHLGEPLVDPVQYWRLINK